MKRLYKHLCWELLLTFGVAILITTFLGLVGNLPKLLGSGDVSLRLALTFLYYSTPKILCYTLPVGLLTATVLVFNRLSADNEITALRATGVSLLQIVTPIILMALVVSGLCWWMWFEITPEYSLRGKLLVQIEALEDPISLIGENSSTELLRGVFIMHGGRVGEDELRDVSIFIQDQETGRISENITAERGKLETDVNTQSLRLILTNVSMARFDVDDPGKPPVWGTTEVLTREINYAKHSNRKPLVRREEEMRMKQLFVWIRMLATENRDFSEYMLELHQRASWSLAPFTLVLIGIPFGLQIARRENYAGLIGAVGVIAVYYIPMTFFAKAMSVSMHPEWFMWSVNLLLQFAGIILLWRRR